MTQFFRFFVSAAEPSVVLVCLNGPVFSRRHVSAPSPIAVLDLPQTRRPGGPGLSAGFCGCLEVMLPSMMLQVSHVAVHSGRSFTAGAAGGAQL